MPGKNPPIDRGGSERAWDLQAIRQLIDLLIERRITEFELEKGGLRIRIKRGDSSSINPAASAHDISPARSPASPPVSSSGAGVAPVLPAASPGAAVPPSTVVSPEAHEDLHIIKSPIVGTFYAAPAPNAPPFVKVGDVVQVGQVLCVIEAMKLMNEIESEVAGEIVRISRRTVNPSNMANLCLALNHLTKSRDRP